VTCRAGVAGLVSGLLATADAAAAVTAARLAADESIRLDGALNEAAWRRAGALDDLRQSQPLPGAAASQRTVVRLAWDDSHLFIAIEAFDAEPGRIVARQMQRDSELFFDDHVTVVLDPHGRAREGYLFRVNPVGARSDALIFEGQREDYDWDGRWHAAARMHDAGWTAEIAIPFTTLSLDPETAAWGINVERRIARGNERVRLAGGLRATPITSLADMLPLTGIQVAAPGLGVRAEPYLVRREEFDHDRGGNQGEFTPGVDIFYQFTPAITGGLTINTDFAEVEVDEQRVNLTRFPLFFPEKREFFLQDTGLFRFAGLGQSPLPFFSRRIGLDATGNPVDIDIGGKLSGRHGPLAFGTLGAHVAAGPNTPAATLGAARAAYELAPGWSAGVIATVGDPRAERDARTLGADLQYRQANFGGPGKALYAEAWWQDTATEDAPDGGAYGFAIDYPNTGFVANARFNHIDHDYDPALGFVFQTGIREASGELGYWMRPDGFDAVIPQFDWRVRERHDRGLEYVLYNPEVYVETGAGDFVFPELWFERERLFAAFEILPGIVIPPGDYRHNRVLLSAGTSRDRALAVEGSVFAGEYFSGQRRDYEISLLWQPHHRYSIGLDYTVNDVDLREGRYMVRVARTRLDVNFTTRLALNFTAQHDNVSERLGMNGRLRWNFAEHHDVFLVVNHEVSTLDNNFRALATDAIAKVALSFAL
jgi:hypothetical protein